MPNTLHIVCVPLRQCLVMSVLYGDSHQLPATLSGADLVGQVVLGVTGDLPEKILPSNGNAILLVFGQGVDINRVKVQLECQANWMGKPVHLKCVRPSGKELQTLGVQGSLNSPIQSKGYQQVQEGDLALQLPFFSGKVTPGYYEVAFGQWLAAVEGAQLASSSTTLHCWIQRSVREPAANIIRNLGVGASIDNIVSSLKLAYGVVFSFDELMREFLNVFQLTTESVTDYVVRLEKAFALLRDNYPKELSKVNKIQHLRERFYQGLRKEIHQRLTPSYEDRSVPYIVLIKRARQ